MTTTTLKPAPRTARTSTDVQEVAVAEASVGMGQIALLLPEGMACAVLGSCIGLVLYEPQRRYAAMAHIVLPTSENRVGTPGKFADTAVATMVERLRRYGIETTRLIAKMAGGANMFEAKGPFQIGKQNAEAVCEHLAAFRIRLLAEHVGGMRGRRTTFDCRTGELMVEVLGSAPVTL